MELNIVCVSPFFFSTCCTNIEKYLKNSKGLETSFVDKIFSWNKVPGKDSQDLILHLKKIFNVENIEPDEIKKENPNAEYSRIIIKTSSAPVIISLDKARNKVIMMSRPLDKGQYEEKQCDVRQLGRELVVGNRLPREELIKPMVNEAEKQMEQIIYGFVYDLALSLSSEDPQVQKEISYFVEVLSNDNKFISTLQKIYSDRHKGFERGYILLTNGRTA